MPILTGNPQTGTESWFAGFLADATQLFEHFGRFNPYQIPYCKCAGKRPALRVRCDWIWASAHIPLSCSYPHGGRTKGGKPNGKQKNSQKTWDVDASAYSSIETIADQENCTVTQIVNEALRYYADRHYLENNATMLSSDILEAMKSTVSLLERRLDNRSNQLLSSMAIQLFIINKVLADSLDLSGDALEQYRVQAVEFLKGNNRLLDLREVI